MDLGDKGPQLWGRMTWVTTWLRSQGKFQPRKRLLRFGVWFGEQAERWGIGEAVEASHHGYQWLPSIKQLVWETAWHFLLENLKSLRRSSNCPHLTDEESKILKNEAIGPKSLQQEMANWLERIQLAVLGGPLCAFWRLHSQGQRLQRALQETHANDPRNIYRPWWQGACLFKPGLGWWAGSHHRFCFIRFEILPAHSARLNIFKTAFIKYFSHKAKLSTFFLKNVIGFIQLKITGQLIIFGKIWRTLCESSGGGEVQ